MKPTNQNDVLKLLVPGARLVLIFEPSGDGMIAAEEVLEHNYALILADADFIRLSTDITFQKWTLG